jgi:hypothetical protein
VYSLGGAPECTAEVDVARGVGVNISIGAGLGASAIVGAGGSISADLAKVGLDGAEARRGEGTEPGLNSWSDYESTEGSTGAYRVASGSARDASKVAVGAGNVGVCRVGRGGDLALARRSAAGVADRATGECALVVVGPALEGSERPADLELVRLSVGSDSGELAIGVDVLEDVASRELHKSSVTGNHALRVDLPCTRQHPSG